jgi:hypothetical protein
MNSFENKHFYSVVREVERKLGLQETFPCTENNCTCFENSRLTGPCYFTLNKDDILLTHKSNPCTEVTCHCYDGYDDKDESESVLECYENTQECIYKKCVRELYLFLNSHCDSYIHNIDLPHRYVECSSNECFCYENHDCTGGCYFDFQEDEYEHVSEHKDIQCTNRTCFCLDGTDEKSTSGLYENVFECRYSKFIRRSYEKLNLPSLDFKRMHGF